MNQFLVFETPELRILSRRITACRLSMGIHFDRRHVLDRLLLSELCVLGFDCWIDFDRH